ncbi:hypothetical protein FSZ17_13365 [Cytobacillus dafuensis]|uniref:Uncharacterized protein n=2 Tax=Cytobacillus dafuensis TaxID=1742359 RepID=A0A5B8ZB31_CYTDA|nr:hypothetical protein FSZ17_13365 [Cytobacillus dafuensis]
MGWALAILFIAAVSLLILSFYKTGQSSTRLEQQIDQLTFSFKDDIDQLQQQIRNFELDAEIAAQEAGVQADTQEQRVLLREMLDMHRRGYSFESISTKNQLTKEEVEQLLAPYIKTKDERSKVANES